MIEVRDIDVFYGNIQVLKGVSLHVTRGEIVALIGANGAGKSTLMKAIVGLLPKKSGDISLEGRSLTRLACSEIIRMGIAVVPEGRRLFGPLSVLDNMNLGAYLRHRDGRKREIQEDLQTMFRIFPRLQERKQQSAGTLSGGEQQMLAIARALMGRPKVLLMDEPSIGLAPIIVREIFEIIRRLKDEGNTLLLVEQNARMALRISDRGYVMELGRVTLEGSAESLLKEESVQKSYLGA